MRSTLSLAFLPVVLCAVVACGGGVSVEDDGSGGNDAASTSTSVSAVGVVSGATATATSTGTSSSDGGAGPVGTSIVASSGEGGSGGIGTTTGEGGFGGGGDVGSSGQGGVGPVGSSGSGTEPFLCGEQVCADGDICCASQQGVSCAGPNDPCQAVLNCQSAANCDNGQICCLQGGVGDVQSLCADECEAGPLGPVQLCESADECPPDVLCQEVFGNYKVCSNGFGG